MESRNPHRHFGRALAFCAAVQCIAASGAARADVVYRNDFSTRTSAGAVPSGEWRSASYAPGKLINQSSDTWGDPFGASDLQDNWTIGQNSAEYYANVADDDGNQMAVLCYTNVNWAIGSVIAKHRIGNVFTSGVVTAQCDMRPPSNWQYASPRSIRLCVGDEAFFSPLTASGDYMSHLAAGAGISVYQSGASASYRHFRLGADLASAATAPNGGATWYRIVITADLDRKTYSVATYELGAAHPSPGTATPATPAWTESGIDFWSVEKGASFSGISAIGIAGYGVSGTTNAADRVQAAQFDNIRVRHDGVLCYENDFTTRRSRCLAPASASAAYPAAATPATNAVEYAVGTRLVAAQDSSLGVQNIGVDGWRRLNKDSSGSLSTVLFQSNATAQSSDDTAKFSWAAHPLGQTFTTGKVKLRVDASVTALSDSGSIRIDLGGDSLYNGTHSGDTAYSLGRVAEAGFSGSKLTIDGIERRQVRYVTSENDSVGVVKSPDAGIVMAQWLRIVVDADLDAKTYSFKLIAQGDKDTHAGHNAEDGATLYEKTGIPFAYPSLDSISCFAIGTYWSVSYFDNIKAWHTPAGATDAALIYENTFAKRILYGCGAEDRLCGTLARNPVGIDGWTRLGTATDAFFLVGGDNPAIGFEDVGTSAAYAVHDLGGSYHNGTMAVRFDMKSPSAWNSAGGYAYLWLGGGGFREGNLNGGDGNFLKWRCCDAGIAAGSPGVFAAYSGNGAGGGTAQTAGTATGGHWYRFVVKAGLSGTGSSNVAVYDMGTAQPTMEAPTPSSGAVATFTDLPFSRSMQDVGRVSCIGLQVKGVPAASPLRAADSRLLVDNVVVEFNPAAFVLVVR